MSQSQQKSQNLVMAIAFIGLMFFAIGFAFGINGFLAGPLNTLYGINKLMGYLVLGLSFLPFLLFAKPATATIKKIGYKKTMALSFVFFAVSFALYAIAATIGKNGLTLFYVSAFIGGIGNAFLNATANPYISVIGPIDSAAKRICVMGICNKLAYPVAIVFFGVLMNALDLGNEITQFSQMVTPFYIIMGIFLALGLLTLAMPLPEVKAEGEDEEATTADTCCNSGKTSIMQYPHAILGALALFIYTGVETMSLNTASEFVGMNSTLDNIKILDKSLLIWFPSFGMILGYLLGVIMIPKVMSQATALRVCSTIGAIGSLGIILFPAYAPWLLLVVAFGCSMGAPAIWPLSLKDLGKFTKTGSTLLTMGIAGGAVFPPLFGFLADFGKNQHIAATASTIKGQLVNLKQSSVAVCEAVNDSIKCLINKDVTALENASLDTLSVKNFDNLNKIVENLREKPELATKATETFDAATVADAATTAVADTTATVADAATTAVADTTATLADTAPAVLDSTTLASFDANIDALTNSCQEAVAHGATIGYWLCLPCFLFILYFAVSGYKLRRK